MIYEIKLEGMHFHAPHGYYEWERIQKNHFTVDLLVSLPYPESGFREELLSTFDYEKAYHIVREVMEQPVLLLETLCEKIIKEIREAFDLDLRTIEIKVAKLQPPLPGRVGASSVCLKWMPEDR